jgi:hypothetical protein
MTATDQPERTHKVCVMLNSAEKAKLEDRAAKLGLPVATFLRLLIRSAPLALPVEGTREGD